MSTISEISSSQSIGFCELVWNNATKGSIVSLFKQEVSDEERLLYLEKSKVELFFYGAKESLKVLSSQWLLIITAFAICISPAVIKSIFSRKMSSDDNFSIERTSGGLALERFHSENVSIINNESPLYICLVAPILEEFFFRVILQQGLSLMNGPRPAIVLSHLSFACVHNSSRAIQIALVGGIMSSLYLKTGSVWASLGAHIANNSFCFLAGRMLRVLESQMAPNKL
jgi:membrane protease YdiL (CAAX protease family)